MDERALKIWTDGSAYNNGKESGLAGIIEYPDDMGREPELVFQRSFAGSTNNRMELMAVILAMEHIKKNIDDWRSQGINRIIIATDSKYVYDGQRYAPYWRKAKWNNKDGRPVENPDLWRRFLSLRGPVSAELVHKIGKTNAVNKLVDKLAKEAAKKPTLNSDSGFRRGKISRAPIKGVATLFPAKGQSMPIRVYRYTSVGVGSSRQHKVFFTIHSKDVPTEKFIAYIKDPEMSRNQLYTAKFNQNLKYPVIESFELIDEDL